MDIVLILKIGVCLIIVLAILIFFLFYQKKQKAKKTLTSKRYNTQKQSLQDLLDIIKVETTSTDTLLLSVEKILNHYPTIDSNLHIYQEIIIELCKHKNTDKKLIVKLTIALEKSNPKYKSQINKAMIHGLN